MEKTGLIWMNGRMVDWDKAQVHVLTHTLHYGTGVFEGIRCYNTRQGPAIFRLGSHVRRLMDSAHIMQMKTGFSAQDYVKACKEVVTKNRLKECYIRPLIYFGYGKMGLATSGVPVDSVVAAWPWASYFGEEGLKNGIRIKVSPFTRHHVNSMMTKAKTVGNYVNSTMAKMDALNSGYDDAIMLDNCGYVAEATAENIFIVRDGELITPPATNALEGITRKSVMEIAKGEKIKVREELFTKDQLYISDECFITGTAAEVTPVREADNRVIGTGKPGPITKKLQSRFLEVVYGKISKYSKWLDYVDE